VINVVIAHRLSTVMHEDRIYVLERGHIAETGGHDALLEAKGLYYAMWRQQVGERRIPAAAGPTADPMGRAPAGAGAR
jgi:ATP-binding cassette subfamily B protein